MKTLLLVLDGMGIANSASGNAITPLTMPFFHGLAELHGRALLQASGSAVGLQNGQAGNSEVGHLTLGAGQRIQSKLETIHQAFNSGAWAKSPVWQQLRGRPVVHVLGLASDAGVHGHVRTLQQAAALALLHGVGRVYVHVILDGVDSQAGSALTILRDLELPAGAALGTVMGRKWATDRSGNLELTQHYVQHVLGHAAAPQFSHAVLRDHLTIAKESTFSGHLAGGAIGTGEPIVLTNHRADRTIQLAKLLVAEREVFSVAELGDAVPADKVFFPTQALRAGLAFELQRQRVNNVRIAESSKFPHVTYFFNGFNAAMGERTVAVPSIPEEQIAARPEMSLRGVLAALQVELRQTTGRFIVANVANLDQVGHTGDFAATQRAARIVDEHLQSIHDDCQRLGWSLVVTGDHGNADCMLDSCGSPLGSHSDNPVPFVCVPAPGVRVRLRARLGSLANVAPSCLALLRMPRAENMSDSLVDVT